MMKRAGMFVEHLCSRINKLPAVNLAVRYLIFRNVFVEDIVIVYFVLQNVLVSDKAIFSSSEIAG